MGYFVVTWLWHIYVRDSLLISTRFARAINKENHWLPKVKKTNIDIRKFIQHARTKRGLSQTAIAQKLCVQNNIISNWESGKEAIPGQYISKLNKILNINIKKKEIY